MMFPRASQRRTHLATVIALIYLPAVAPAAPVESLLEIRHRNVVIQEWDLSCGAAALTTILRFQHGDPVSEREVAIGLMGRSEYLADPSIVTRREGFSLKDLKNYVTKRGYIGRGMGGLGLQDIVALAPIIVPIRTLGYNHFIVVKGIKGNRISIADPAWGNRTMLLEHFMDSWIAYPKTGRIGFTVSRPGESFPINNKLLPLPDEFVFLR